MTRFAARRARLIKLMQEAGAEGLLVSNVTNVTYLTGFTGDSSHLLLTGRDEMLVSDFRYITQLEEECPGLRTHIRPNSILLRDAAIDVIGSVKVGRLAIEGDSFTVADYAHLTAKLPKLAIVSTTGVVEQLREIKDEEELAEIRRAIEVAERAFAVVRGTLRPGQTEKELADELDHQLRLQGAQGSCFPTIVAADARAALPHARPTTEPIDGRDLLLVDWGANCGYKSDLTRVLVTGRISPKLELLYGVVLKAQEQAIAAIRPGKTGCEIDAIARGIIADAGFDKYFGHGLGHGIGLDVHELPRLSPISEKPLEAGMVVTVEPGIYLPGWGGIRIEDDVLVTRRGHEVLTSCPKQLADAIVH